MHRTKSKPHRMSVNSAYVSGSSSCTTFIARFKLSSVTAQQGTPSKRKLVAQTPNADAPFVALIQFKTEGPAYYRIDPPSHSYYLIKEITAALMASPWLQPSGWKKRTGAI